MDAFFDKVTEWLKEILIVPFYYSASESEISVGFSLVMAVLGGYLATFTAPRTALKFLLSTAVLLASLFLHYRWAEIPGIFYWQLAVRAIFSFAFGFVAATLLAKAEAPETDD